MSTPLLSSRFARIFISLVLIIALLGMFMPATVSSPAYAEEEVNVQSDEEINALLSAQEYAEGEALVIVDESIQSSSGEVQALNSDLLSSADTLMSVTEEVYEEAIHERGIAEAQTSEGVSAQSFDEENIAIKHITQTGMSTEELLRALRDDPRVRYVEPNYVYQVENSTPSVAAQNSLDPIDIKDVTGYQWGNDNQGTADTSALVTENKVAGFAINAPQWETSRTTGGVVNAEGVVAVVDTGIDFTHPDLENVMHGNMTQYVSWGGYYGFNAYEADASEPMDANGHGTHCAGIIAAEWNDYGTSGVASGVKLVGIKVGDHSLPTSAILNGYEYLAQATEAGLDLRAINNSWGGNTISNSFFLAVTKLGKLGAISVVASGNDGNDVDNRVETGAVLRSNPYAVVVNSSTMSAGASVFTNYGTEVTDIFAPGSFILSTVPAASSGYLPEAIKDASKNIVYENFNTAMTSSVEFYADKDHTLPLGGSDTQNYYDNDAPGGNASRILETDSMTDVLGDRTRLAFFMGVDVAAGQEQQAQQLSFRMRSLPGEGYLIAFVGVLCEDENGAKKYVMDFSQGTDMERGDWGLASVDIPALCVSEEGVSYTPIYENGKLEFIVMCAYSEGSIEVADTLWVDCLGIGRDDALVPYGYLSGTSMATPAATGAAAVLAKDDSAGTKSEQALARAERLKASVNTSYPAFNTLCTSGGHLDLSIPVSQYNPVINSARLSETETMTIGGVYFGATPGTVTVSGESASVISWSENEVVVDWPSSVGSGVHEVAVTTAGGLTAKKSFLFQRGEGSDDSSTPLFEIEYPVPSEQEEDIFAGIMTFEMCGLGGSIYALPLYEISDASARTLYRLDPVEGTWEYVSDLPLILNLPSMTTYDGMLLISGFGGINEDDAGQKVITYDPTTVSWGAYDAAQVPVGSTLVNANETLYAVGGFENMTQEVKLDGVCSYDPDTGVIQQVATLLMPGAALDVVAYDNTIAVTHGGLRIIDQSEWENRAELVDLSSGTTIDLFDALPTFEASRTNSFGLASVAEGIALSGASGVTGQGIIEDQDTYCMSVNGGAAEQATPFNKRASHAQLFQTEVTSHRGYLYTFGLSYFEEGESVLRATKLDTLAQPGDYYTITYHGVSAEDNTNPTTYTARDLDLTLADAADQENAHFAGWFDNAEWSGTALTAIPAGTTGDIELWAKWEPKSIPNIEPVPNDPQALSKTGDSLGWITVLGSAVMVSGIVLAAYVLRRRRRG